MKRILALDQSSRITGWAVFEDNKLIKYGKFTAEDNQVGQRLQFIRNKVKELIDTYEITEVVLEDIQMQSNVANNVQTFKVLAEVFGVISELLVELRIPQSAVLAATWKSELGIKGRARAQQKQNAQEWVSLNYSVKPTQDECDAICIGSYKAKNQGHNWAN